MTLGLSVCCMTTGRSPARLASILSLFGDVADEIVIAVEEPQALGTYDAVAHVADRVLTFSPTGPPDRPIAWLFGACTGKWILNVDDDEIPSPRLIERLPQLIERNDITHGWIARRWLYRTTGTHLAQAPWSTEFQLRLVLADSRFLQFSDVFHRPVVAHGPGLYVDAPLWHLDTLVNPFERRRAKADAYEIERPGMRVSGLAHNDAFYLPELMQDVALGSVPRDDRAWIDSVMAGDARPTRPRPARLVRAPGSDIDRAWPGTPYGRRLHRGRVSIASAPHSMRAGVQETIDVYVRNESDRAWRWGKDARPEIRIGYFWKRAGAPVYEAAALRTTLPADLAPGESQFMPVHVVPPEEPGLYTVQLELVHEGVSRFGLAALLDVDVRDRELLAVMGASTGIRDVIAKLRPPPQVEPVVVLGNDSDRADHGDYPTVSGLRGPLLGGLESSGRLARAAQLPIRSGRIVSSARRYRRSGIQDTPQCADLFSLLRRSRGLVICGPDWPADAAAGREWWRLVTTLLVSRAVGTAVYFADDALPRGVRGRDRFFRRLIRWFGVPLESAELWPQPRLGVSPLAEPVPLRHVDDRAGVLTPGA